MRNVFKKSLAVMALVPTMFMFSACEEKYDLEENVEDFNEAVQSVETLGTNFTQTVTIEADESLEAILSAYGYNLSDSEIVIKVDDENTSVSMDGIPLTYYVDNTSYAYNDGKFDVDSFEYKSSTIKSITNIAGLDFENLKTFAFMLNKKAITTKGNTVSVKFDFGELYNETVENIIENQNKPIIYFIDEMLDDLFDDMSVEGLVQEFKAMVTTETTIEQAMNFIKEKTGLNPDMFIASYASAFMAQSHKVTGNGNLGFVEFNFSEEFDIEAIKNQPLLTMLEMTGSDLNTAIDNYLAKIKNSANTLKSSYIQQSIEKLGTIQKAEAQWNEMIASFNTMKVKDFYINLDITTDDNNVLKSYAFGFKVNVVVLESGMEIGMKMGGKIKAEISNIGTTEVELPSNMQINDVKELITIPADSITLGEDLVIKGISSKYADFEIDGVATLSDSDLTSAGKELVISHEAIQEYLTQDDVNGIRINGAGVNDEDYVFYIYFEE